MLMNEFEGFWNFYNKKTGKAKAEKLWMKLKRHEIEKIRQTIKSYIQATPDKQFRKDPCTYLRNKCWNDEGYLPEPEKNVKRLQKGIKFSVSTQEEREQLKRAYQKRIEEAKTKPKRGAISMLAQEVINKGRPMYQKDQKQIEVKESEYQKMRDEYFKNRQ